MKQYGRYGTGRPAFTLAELLIALVILGVIATFTIPKVLSSQQDQRNNAVVKEAIGMVSGAYQTYRISNTPSTSFSGWDLTPYMNYVAVDTSHPIDDWQTGSTWGCDSGNQCIYLHNGARMWMGAAMNGNYSTSVTEFQIDPDGVVTNGAGGDTSATAPGKSLDFMLYYDGTIRNYGSAKPNTQNVWGNRGGDPSVDPVWFHWS